MALPLDPRKERTALVALFAVFALLVQALIPAAAIAGPRLTPGDVLCAEAAARAAIPGDPASDPSHKTLGMPCQNCLAAALAVIVSPDPVFDPVTYAVARVEHAPDAAPVTPRARGPPRPFGQGPPSTIA